MAFLGNGKINNQKEIICPLHEYRFDLETGQVKSGDCADLKVYKADLTETGLEIEL
ncbi:biphenyl dioxygenase [Indibacter alkaliphilus LW1]|uniref:Biphenyl dioxygenase n=2 Tax=Indibacter TaxID=647744 RepID=S2DV76_INDAL|nr:biphenyl dioxygenase [Indibacter alkaliphilus LW1]